MWKHRAAEMVCVEAVPTSCLEVSVWAQPIVPMFIFNKLLYVGAGFPVLF